MQVVIVVDAAQPANGTEFVDHMEFKGNPLAAPIGKMGLVVMPAMPAMPFNGQLGMNPAMSALGVQPYGMPVHLYLTKNGDFSLDGSGKDIFIGTISQHVEKIIAKITGRHDDIDLRVMNRRYFNPGAGGIFQGQYHVRLDVSFDPVPSQAVVLRKTEDGKWFVRNRVTETDDHIRLKRHESGSYTIEEGAKDITVHISIKEIVCSFAKSGELVSVKYKDADSADDAIDTVAFSVNDPFLNLIEGFTPVVELE